MSAQFGRWNFEGRLLEPQETDRIANLLARYAPDQCASYALDGISAIHAAHHTTAEDRTELQPLVTGCGNVMLWDGRLDNREELIADLKPRRNNSSDLRLAAFAYEQWGLDCFRRLKGDWAMAVCRRSDHTLVLAKDFLGARPLYFWVGGNEVAWSTLLEPLVLLQSGPLEINEEYLAGWLFSAPLSTMTPYRRIHSVPPASFVLLGEGRTTTKTYWDFDPERRIVRSDDREYEEEFLSLFAQSLGRRLRSDAPVVAELSGGMDSSSIVCMAHHMRTTGQSNHLPLATVSYYDDSEPNWNERPYFEAVERSIGQTGRHINFGPHNSLSFRGNQTHFAAPTAAAWPDDCARQLSDCLLAGPSQILLSGFGGDEVLGGVPTPLPELADLFVAGNVRQLGKQMTAFALASRRPTLHLAGELARLFLPCWFVRSREPAPWISPAFLRRHKSAFRNYGKRLKFFGAHPSFQDALGTLDVIRRTLAARPLPANPAYEKRFPYLDRDLLEFLFAIPREQLVRPGERRSLMRRAMAGIVPEEILERRRKAFVARKHLAQIAAESQALAERAAHMVTASLGIVDPDALSKALRAVRNGQTVQVGTLIRTLLVESWMTELINRGFISMPPGTDGAPPRRDDAFRKEPSCRVA